MILALGEESSNLCLIRTALLTVMDLAILVKLLYVDYEEMTAYSPERGLLTRNCIFECIGSTETSSKTLQCSRQNCGSWRPSAFLLPQLQNLTEMRGYSSNNNGQGSCSSAAPEDIQGQ